MTATGPELAGSFGMAASTHWLATASAMSLLERGGNAFDAAVSAGFVLQVVQPHLDGPGGEAPAILWSETEQSLLVLNGQGVAPQAASIAAFAELGLSEVPGTGLLAATVPGAFGAWMLLLARYGTWTVRDVLDHAIGYARTGFRAGSSLVGALTSVREMFATEWPTSHRQWSGQLATAQAGRPVTNPVLASMYEQLVAACEAASATRDGQIAAAVRYWYSGPVAERIADFCAGSPWLDTSGRAHRGLLTAADLQAWQPTFEAPLTFDYGRYTVAKSGPWGQGPVFLQQLALLTGLDLELGEHLSAQYIHTVTEAGKLAFADREAWYGDGADPDVMAALLSPSYNDQRRQLVTGTASGELRPGSPLGRVPRLPQGNGSAASLAPGGMNGAGEPITRTDGRVRGDTCHLDVADRWGNLVSVTPSGGWLQSSPTIPELGFCLGTRAQMFWLDEALPNSLRPGARPRTTLSPSLALRDGEPWLAFGTPGGDQQDQWSLHFFLALAGTGTGTGANLRQALDSPMFHSEHFPSSFWPREAYPLSLVVEESIDADVRAELARRGHDVTVVPAWTLGRISAVAREQAADGGWHLRAAADVRGGEGYAAGR